MQDISLGKFSSNDNSIRVLKVVIERVLENISEKRDIWLVQNIIWVYLCRPVQEKVCVKVIGTGPKKKFIDRLDRAQHQDLRKIVMM